MDRRVTMSINGEPSPELVLNHSTPQGSPLSPLLSAIYLIPLLRLAESWKFHGLLTYVDDSSIFMMGPTHKIATDHVAAALRSMTEWLTRNSLGIDFDKTEYISFQPPCASTRYVGYQIDNLALGLPGGRVLSVRRSNMV